MRLEPNWAPVHEAISGAFTARMVATGVAIADTRAPVDSRRAFLSSLRRRVCAENRYRRGRSVHSHPCLRTNGTTMHARACTDERTRCHALSQPTGSEAQGRLFARDHMHGWPHDQVCNCTK